MNRPPKSIIIQAVAIPFIIAGVVIALLNMDGQSEAARYSAVLPLSYLLGSIPTAYIIGRLVRGLDIRGYGSGNVGSANQIPRQLPDPCMDPHGRRHLGWCATWSDR